MEYPENKQVPRIKLNIVNHLKYLEVMLGREFYWDLHVQQISRRTGPITYWRFNGEFAGF